MLEGASSGAAEVGRVEPAIAERPPRITLILIAGVLTLITGVLSMYNGIAGVNAAVGPGFDVSRDDFKYPFCAVFLVAFGIVALVGGYSAIRGRYVMITVIGACLGMAGGGLAGFWLGLTALVLIFFSDADLTG